MYSDIENKYMLQIKEKDYLISFQNIVLDISFQFMGVNEENFNKKVNNLLKNIGDFFNVDRTYLFTINTDNNTMTYSHEWCNTDINPEISTIKEIPIETFPWWVEQLKKNNLVYIEDVNNMPTEANAEQIQLFRQNVKSLVSVPIIVQGEMKAFIGIDSVKLKKEWSMENINLLYTMAKILSNGIRQINFNKKIDFMTYHDILTGLPNRLLVRDRINQAILRGCRKKTLISIMLIDLDEFKVINDTLGHDQGDELLKQVSKRLLSLVRKSDTVSRISGDEFIVFFNDYMDEKSIDIMAQRIIDIFKEPFILRGQDYFITASAGISQYPRDGDDVKTLIKNADMAMYKAKSMGKNQYQKCSSQLKNLTFESITLTNDLYGAIERDEIFIYYQPKVKGLTSEIVGAEALLRWNHPKFGLVAPSKFIPLAEKTRLIIPMGNWVLKKACEQAKKWQEEGFKPIKMSVNLSVYQLNNPNILEQIKDVLDKTSLEAKYLELEITESSAMDNICKTKRILENIKKLGITISIDDYGKGYSSLIRLKELPIDKIKVDMSFVHSIGVSEKDEMIIKSLIYFASNLGLETIAEGVETKEQVDFLNKTNCDQLQGYYFFKPMDAIEMGKLLKNNYQLNYKGVKYE